MLAEFLININRSGSSGPGQKILLTVSGGIDSVVMARLFSEAGLSCGVAHCNFGLRGEESDGDALFVKELAGRFGFAFHEIRFDTKKFATERKISTQMAARQLRYDWFGQIAEDFGYSRIATAHHGGDQVETVLLNLVRGTGLRGLRGMQAVNGKIIRPMLFATRERIAEYAEEKGLSWREDRSNSDDYYRRNRIRLHVVPVLKSINPSLESTVSDMSERLSEAGVLLESVAAAWKKEVWSEAGRVARISIAGLKDAVSPAYLLHSVLEEFGFSHTQAKEIVRSLDGIAGKEFHSPTHLLVKDRDFLVMTEKEGSEGESPQEEITPEVFPKPEDFTVRPEPYVAFFDADRLKTPLTVRSWQPGDVFLPFGMGGRRKKVSDLLTDLKVDRIAKAGVKVVVDREGNIIWVVGIRGDHATRVTDGTKNIARISWSER